MKRKLTKKAREEIRRAFLALGGCGIPEDHLIKLLADHATGLLELSEEETRDWFEPG